MKHPTPPLHLLLTVEAAVRLRSFKATAAELHITPSAVSHRIRSLEKLLGRSLFERTGHQVQASEDTARLAASVAHAMLEVGRVWELIRTQASKRSLRISCLPTFAARFVLPNFPVFLEYYPSVSLDLTSHDPLAQLTSGTVDTAVYYGNAAPTGFWSELLKRSSMLPVVAKAAYSRAVNGKVLMGPLVDFASAKYTWKTVIADLGFGISESARTIHCESVMAACVAAEAGVGIALLPDWVAQQAIARGTVMALRDEPVQSANSYWLVTRPGEESFPHNLHFKQWLRQQMHLIEPPLLHR